LPTHRGLSSLGNLPIPPLDRGLLRLLA
jgi:hypothetical protein